jgi:NTP pyrophosphatase (non-canonical NTP hydrolase)
MTNQEYTDWVRAHNFYPKTEFTLGFFALGLTGEAGEVAEKIKKHYRDDAFLGSTLLFELGDVLWYLTAIAGQLGCTLDDIIEYNVAKLESRYDRGVAQGSGDNR